MHALQLAKPCRKTSTQVLYGVVRVDVIFARREHRAEASRVLLDRRCAPEWVLAEECATPTGHRFVREDVRQIRRLPAGIDTCEGVDPASWSAA